MERIALSPALEAAAAAALMPHLPIARILDRYRGAKGNELASGKFARPESSAALVANTFGLFIDRPGDIPEIPGWSGGWTPLKVLPEVELRFPWRGGLHPWLDAIVETSDCLIGIESKRYEPFRMESKSNANPFSEAYSRDVWGPRMRPFESLRDDLSRGAQTFDHLDAPQLVKHAFALRTQALRLRKNPILVYLYAEPKAFPSSGGKAIPEAARAKHYEEVSRFSQLIEAAEVQFMALNYSRLINAFKCSPREAVRAHGEALSKRFDC